MLVSSAAIATAATAASAATPPSDQMLKRRGGRCAGGVVMGSADVVADVAVTAYAVGRFVRPRRFHVLRRWDRMCRFHSERIDRVDDSGVAVPTGGLRDPAIAL